MPRPRRIEIEGGVYHLYNRFVGGTSFFNDAGIVRKFKDVFYSTAEFYGVKIIAYVCMSNHFHSLIQIPGPVLSKFIQKYSTRFARIVNILNDRKGHVFQGRHRTSLVDEKQYLMTVIAYIFYNPVRAGIVERVEDYQWSNYHEITNENDNQNYDIIYEQFHRDRNRGRLAFVKWLNDMNSEKSKNIIYNDKKGQFLMEGANIEQIFEKINRRNKDITAILMKDERRKRQINSPYIAAERIEEIIEHYNLEFSNWEGLWRSERKFILHLKWFLLRNYSKMSLTDIAISEKQIRHTTVSQALRIIEKKGEKMECIYQAIKKLGM